jgi:hypothetical protein
MRINTLLRQGIAGGQLAIDFALITLLIRHKLRGITVKPIVISFALLLACLVTGCKEQSVSTQAHFILSVETVSSWREVEQGILVKLTYSGSKAIFDLTRENINKPVELYVQTLLASSPVIRESISNGSVMLVLDSEMKKKVFPLLPSDKRTE